MYTIDSSGNIKIPRGDSAEIPFTFSDANSNPIDITNCSVITNVKLNYTDTDYIFTITTSNHTDPTQGKTVVSIPSSTTLIDVNKYHLEFSLSNSSTNTVDRFYESYLVIDNSLR